MAALDPHAAVGAAKVGLGRALPRGPGPPALQNSRLQPAGGWMPQAAWETMLANALHPLRVNPRNLPAPKDHQYVLTRLRKTPQGTQRDGIRLSDIIQSPTPPTHTPLPPHKRPCTDAGGAHSTPGAQRGKTARRT